MYSHGRVLLKQLFPGLRLQKNEPQEHSDLAAPLYNGKRMLYKGLRLYVRRIRDYVCLDWISPS